MFNLVILLGLMAYVGAVMTLPGIAGFVLTMGMGVDSNVLIFERWSVGPTTFPLGSRPLFATTVPFHAVASWASNELGVWNQERV